MGYRDYPTRMPVDPAEKERFLRKLGLDHLLRAWQWFEVYQLSPYATPYFAMKREEYDDEEGGGEGGDGFKVIDLKNGLVIYDFGDYLATSAGEEYGALATGRLLRTVDKMMAMLEKRGAQEIAFGKECVHAAKLYAWHKATVNNIQVFDFRPSEEDLARLGNTFGSLDYQIEEVSRPE